MSNLGARGRLSSSQSWPSLVAICLLLGSACGGAATLAPGTPEILPSSRTVLMVDGAELTAWHRIDLWLPLGGAGAGGAGGAARGRRHGSRRPSKCGCRWAALLRDRRQPTRFSGATRESPRGQAPR